MAIDVVVLGGGYLGVCAARRIARRSARASHRDQVAVTLVSMSRHHAFHGWTAEVLTGHVREHRAHVPLAELLPGTRQVNGLIVGVDLVQRTVGVATDAGLETLRYDRLVIGVGSRDAVSDVPGLAEYGWSLKSEGGLHALNRHLARIVTAAATCDDAAERARLLTVVVAGGGLTGTEVAAAIAERLRAQIARETALAEVTAHVVLIARGEKLLPALRPRFDRVADYATTQTVRAGVTVRTGIRLAAVSTDGALLDDGAIVPCATVVSTVGQTPMSLPGTEHLARDASGRLIADRFLRVAPDVWAGGDVAAVPHPSGEGVCPANALWAIHHGRCAGENVVRSLTGRRPTPFRFPGLGQGASLGIGRGAGELYGLPLTGWSAWIARWLVFHAFMPSRRVALATVLEWLRGPILPTAGPEPLPSRSVSITSAPQTEAPRSLG